jgi:hypothetical protein
MLVKKNPLTSWKMGIIFKVDLMLNVMKKLS